MSENIPQFSVAEFSKAIKLTIENAFGYVKISGEITGFKRASSGHLYFNLKEDSAVLTAVCFRNQANDIDFEIGDGLQICASGKITSYEGRSNYQIIVDKIEIAGIGAILEMIEKRRKKLAEEGLFDAIYKKKLPFFPKIIGVITSETGAVIEDIKHRILNRCPLNLILYPSAVQGEKASREIIAGIKYFNNLKINRPEVIIIARGGGSFEDLLPFNDEDLVREVFKSEIPIISAVGHETDFTLIDFVADVRAPTPTAGAEFATPVLEDLKINLRNLERNISNFVENFFNKNHSALKNLERNLLSPQKFLENSQQKIINFSEKIEYSTKNFIENNFLKIQKIQILSPQKFLENSQQKIINFSEKIEYSTKNFIENNFLKIQKITIKSDFIFERIKIFKQKIFYDFDAIKKNIENNFIQKNIMIEGFANAIKSCNYQQMLERGFAVLKDKDNHLILNCEDLKNHQKFIITMQDGEVSANLSDNLKNQNSPPKKIDTQPNFFDLIEK